MNEESVRVANSLVFIQDERLSDVPHIGRDAHVWRTSSSLAVSCLPDSEGETQLVLLEVQDAPSSGMVCIFDDEIETPSGWITVETLPDVLVFRAPAAGPSTRVRVWTNGHQASDVVVMRFGD